MAAIMTTESSASRRMRATKGRDNPRERAIRSSLHAQGLRYRKHFPVPGLPRRTIDLAFTRHRIAIFLDGCFWHGCPLHGTIPVSNADYWIPKLARNVERDQETNLALLESGWTVLRFWEHEAIGGVVAEVQAAVISRDPTLSVVADA